MVNKEVSKVYAAVLASPWMGEMVKLSLKVTRREALLFSQFMERGLSSEEAKAVLTPEATESARVLVKDMLIKAGVPEELSQSFQALSSNKPVA